MTQLSLRIDDGLARDVRARAAETGTSVNRWIADVLRAAVDPSFAGSEVERIRERLARAGLLHVPAPTGQEQPDPEAVRRGWMNLVRRHHPDLVARHRAPAITHLAEELTILANRAYDRQRAALVAEGRAAAGEVRSGPARNAAYFRPGRELTPALPSPPSAQQPERRLAPVIGNHAYAGSFSVLPHLTHSPSRKF